MKKFKTLNFLLLYLFCNCSQSEDVQNKNQRAVLLNNNALNVYSRNLFNKDSLNKALVLLDSAILIKRDINFYYNKYAVLRRLGEYKMAINVCDSILDFKSNQFRANLYKGYLYEDLNLKDSETFYYKAALRLIDSTKLFTEDNILRDREQLILLGLLNDSATYHHKLTEFKIKYSNANNQFAQLYINELEDFDREKYLSNY